LVGLGHDVVLFASGDSQTSAELEACWPRALRLDGSVRDPNALHMSMLERVRHRADDFDLLHFHLDYYPFSLFSRQRTPFVTTLHGRLDLPDLDASFERCFAEAPFVSISDAQRAPLPHAHWLGTVHHGLPKDLLKPNDAPEAGYLAFLGRIAPEKGPETAIRLARAAGLPLKIAAKIDKADRAYFEAQVKPLIESTPGVEFVGEIDEWQKGAFLGRARALLFPIRWPEPFGLVLIEAMACGIPVIAFRHGSVPEIVEDGVTGFVVEAEDEAGALRAIARLPTLDRRRVRETFERRFTARRMAEDYLKVYRDLAESRTPKLRVVKA
jgi:glycosyltransferase involved in cell wall biosynthesis